MELLALVLRTATEPLVVEANFRERNVAAFRQARVVQIFCTDEPDVLLERYRARGERHPGHLDDERVPDPGEYRPLELDGDCFVYRIGDDVQALIEDVRRCVR